MKKVIMLIMIGFICQNINAQIAYYDAIDLAKHIPVDGIQPTKADAIEILKKYLENDKLTNGEVVEIVNDLNNDFLRFNVPKGGLEVSQQSGLTPTASKLNFAKIANADATMVSDALAKFLITRAKAELTIAFFDRFKKFTEDNKEIKILFPKTCAQLVDLLSVDYEKMLNVLREKFIEDLDNLPNSFVEVADYLSDEQELPELKLAVNSIRLAKRLEYLSPTEFIEQLPTLTDNPIFNTCAWCKNLNSSLQLSVILSNSVRLDLESAKTIDKNKTRAWVSAEDFYKNILSDEKVKKTFYGLIQLQIKTKKIVFNDDLLYKEMAKSSVDIDFNLDRVEELIRISTSIEKSVKEFKARNDSKKEITTHEYYKYVNHVLSLANFGNKYYTHYSKKEGVDKYIKYAESANNLYLYTADKRYSEAFSELISILEYSKGNSVTFHEELAKKIGKIDEDNFVQNQSTKKYEFQYSGQDLNDQEKNYVNRLASSIQIEGTENSDVKTSVKKSNNKEKSELKKEAKTIGKLKVFGIVITGLAESETSDEAASVLEAAVLPVGSSILRKQSQFTINVSAYVGARTTFTYDENSPFKTGPDGRWVTTLTAPIGLDFGWGLGKAGSISLNAVLLDIGAVVDYRLSNDSSAIESKISWGNIFSPGASIMYGLPGKIPIAVGVSAQYGPGLTSVSVDKTTVNTPAWRYGFIFAVDIPLFNFVNIPKYKRK